ncbi:MAG: hypothetical protein IJM59_07055 [Proteobacteria bacterium]|nr:hypothetical protein [Pseudomonadota bacterium]
MCEHDNCDCSNEEVRAEECPCGCGCHHDCQCGCQDGKPCTCDDCCGEECCCGKCCGEDCCSDDCCCGGCGHPHHHHRNCEECCGCRFRSECLDLAKEVFKAMVVSAVASASAIGVAALLKKIVK